MRHFKLLLAALVALSFYGSASAETRVVAPNRASAIFYYYTYDMTTCGYGGKSKFTVTSKPKHGSVTARWQAYRMGKESRYCAGKPMKGMLVIYSPEPGFHGSDSVSFAFSSMESGYGLGHAYSIDINVK